MPIKAEGGNILVRPTGGVLATDCVVASNPCVDCNVNQPDATVTISGACDSACSQFAGTYSFCQASANCSPAGCCWCWCMSGPFGPTSAAFYLVAYYQDGAWCAYIAYVLSGNCADQFCGGVETYGTEVVSVTCDPATGKLTGSFVLTGHDVAPGVNCQGCTAYVTLGSGL